MPDRLRVDALLHFHYRVDPATLDDEQYWKLWGEYDYVHEHMRKMHLGVMRQVLGELLGAVKPDRQ